uniref:F-box protein AT5G49610-like beta-propeller domain-containing protein n=1 Tax=Arundo donax TaxID=35708 RepID=A0A0A9H3D6_ARUDO
MSCLCLYLSYNGEEIGAGFSILQSGVWSNVRSSVTELPQRLFSTVVAHKLLVGSKFYIMTTLGYILGLDLTTASFFTVKLPDGARDSTTLKLSRPQHAGLYLIEAKGFQLRIWHGDGLEQRALVNTISVREACGHLRSRLARLQLLHFSATVSKPEKSHFTGSGGFFSSQFIFVLIYVTASCYNVATVLLQCFQRSRSQQEPCQTSP